MQRDKVHKKVKCSWE